MEFLRDPIWQFIGALLGLIAILVAILVGRKRKRLAYELSEKTSMLRVGSPIRKRVQILFDDAPVEEVTLQVIKLINSGNIPIRLPAADDEYQRQVGWTFGEDSQILSAEVSETKPDYLDADIEYDGTTVRLLPVLLNQKSGIKISVLLSHYDEKPKVFGHIEGITKIQQVVEPRARYRTLGDIIMLIGTVLIILIALLRRFEVLSLSLTPYFLAVVMIIIIVISRIISYLFRLEKW